jgi:hypothetical protein
MPLAGKQVMGNRVIDLRSQVPLLDMGGARTLACVERHMRYIEKKGALGLETDMDTRAGGQGFARDLVKDWDLDLEALKHYSKKTFRDEPPKLVHNIVFSMPAGTSPRARFPAGGTRLIHEWWVNAVHPSFI